jgi:hypothetical protein
METKQLDDLQANPNNPRTMSREDANALSMTMQKYGDLSGFVFNVRTGMLVCGHMRTGTLKKLPGEKRIEITERYAQPNSVGTVAIGYIVFNDEKYTYREVDWDEATATAAGLAANHLHGDDDADLLAEANYMLQQNAPDLLALTGQSEKEIEKSLNRVSGAENENDEDEKPDDDTKNEKWTFALTPDQSEFVHRAIDLCKKLNGLDPQDHGTALFYLCKLYLDGHKDNEQPAEKRLDDV